jgi:VanZ family protein
VPDLHRLPSPLTYVAGKVTPGRDSVQVGPGRRASRPYTGPVARRRFLLWAPVVGWAAVIFALSSIPDLGTDLGIWDLIGRKIAHAVEFAILGALLFRALGRTAVSVVAGSLYAVSDEVHQSFVEGRVGSPLDWAIDTVGVALGVALLARRR